MMRSAIAFLLLGSAWAAIAGEVLQPGDRLAICGDSITAGSLYPRYIEAYLLACGKVPRIAVAVSGQGGETAGVFAGRAQPALAWFKPTVVTLCHGMNEALRGPREVEKVTADYSAALTRTLGLLAGAGVRVTVVAGPGIIDPDAAESRPDRTVSSMNVILAALSESSRSVAAKAGMPFADLHHLMMTTIRKAKAELGPGFTIGGEGVHPGGQGALLMAWGLLKTLGCDGDIGRIDLRIGGGSTASDGHVVVKAEGGAVELRSSRWPFVLSHQHKGPERLRTMAQYCSFIADLDRFVLVVPDCPWPRATVTWGGETQVFSKEQLSVGINLMQAFIATPFDADFATLLKAVVAKQGVEQALLGELGKQHWKPEAGSPLIAGLLARRQEALQAVSDAFRPVTHHLTVSKTE